MVRCFCCEVDGTGLLVHGGAILDFGRPDVVMYEDEFISCVGVGGGGGWSGIACISHESPRKQEDIILQKSMDERRRAPTMISKYK